MEEYILEANTPKFNLKQYSRMTPADPGVK